MRKVAILFAVVLFSSCSPEKEMDIEQVKIITRDPKVLAEWYQTNLGFEVHQNELSYSDFKIRLQKNENAASPDALKEAFHLKQIPGFSKLGFITNQFDELVQKLESNNVRFVGGIIYDKTIDKRSVIVKDPDGNKIQLFEGFGEEMLKPYYLAVVVESIGEQEKWYQMKLPVRKTHNLDLPDKKVFVRLLEGEDFVIELVDASSETIKKELDKHERIGFHSVTVKGANSRFEKDHEGNLIIHQ